MKAKFLFLLFIIITSLTIVSCKDKILDEHPEFQGYWYGEQGNKAYELTIDQKSKGSYKETEYTMSGTKFITATGVTRIDDNLLKIGVSKFTIDKFPYTVNDTTLNIAYKVMVLSGIEYYQL